MNKNIRVFAFPAVGIVLFLIIALFCTACSHTESYQETTMDFYAAHRTELQAAQATLQDFAEANDDSMLIRPVEALGKDYQNEGVCVKRVNELYFISRKGEYAAEVYQSIYESVLPLFRDGLSGIAASGHQTQFCVVAAPERGLEASLIWTDGERAPTGSYPTVLRQQQLNQEWYAIVVSD
jgi:hypothetical protein